jgi:sulfatase modifying factor 1
MLTITKVRFRLKLLFMLLICSIHVLAQQKKIPVCHVPVPSKKGIILAKSATKVALGKSKNTLGMVQIPGGTFQMGSHSKDGRSDEYPVHLVKLTGFWMDQTEVTNAQFQEFVQATGYVTTAERPIDWEEMKKQVPIGTPRPPDSLLEASSLVFTPTTGPVNLNDYSQWWQFKRGANWHH